MRLVCVRFISAGQSRAGPTNRPRSLGDRVTLNGASCNVARGNHPTTVKMRDAGPKT